MDHSECTRGSCSSNKAANLMPKSRREPYLASSLPRVRVHGASLIRFIIDIGVVTAYARILSAIIRPRADGRVDVVDPRTSQFLGLRSDLERANSKVIAICADNISKRLPSRPHMSMNSELTFRTRANNSTIGTRPYQTCARELSPPNCR